MKRDDTYAKFKGETYRVSQTAQGEYVLFSNDVKSRARGFKPYFHKTGEATGTYYLKVKQEQLEDIYLLRNLVDYKGAIFSLRAEEGDELVLRPSLSYDHKRYISLGMRNDDWHGLRMRIKREDAYKIYEERTPIEP